MDDLADNSPQVTVALGIIEVAELSGSLVEARVGRCKTLVFSAFWWHGNIRCRLMMMVITD